jgi:hypothetical protein
MTDPLAGCFAKLDRARENFRELHDAIMDYRHGQPYTIAVNEDFETGWQVIRFECDPLPLRIPAIAGDMFHNLRSSLDNLVWQLVLANGNIPGRHTAFPIFRDRQEFVHRVGRKRRNSRRANGPLTGVAPKAWALIESLQPYHARYPDFNFLSVINRFANMDKHETVPFTVMLPGETGLLAV